MGVIGFSFIKFDCERKAVPKGGVEVKHNISISKIEKTTLNLGTGKDEVLRIEFTFDVLYEGFGKIGMKGDVIYTDTKEIMAESLKSWDSDKKLNPMVNEKVFKFIYSKTIVKALELADSLNLPSPIPLPKVNFNPSK